MLSNQLSCKTKRALSLATVALGLVTSSTTAHTTPTEDWQTVPTRTAKSAHSGQDPFFDILDGRELAGHWLRVTATIKGKADLRPLVHGFQGDRRVSSPLPTPCHSESTHSVQECSVLAWIPVDAQQVRVRWWNRDGRPVSLSIPHVEIWRGGVNAQAPQQLDDLLARVQAMYAWSSEVDWQAIKRTLEPMATAPAPSKESLLPHMAAALLDLLPRHEHMGVRALKDASQSPTQPDTRPSCQLQHGRLVLRLPATPNIVTATPEQVEAYVGTAHACLRLNWRTVTLDLRESRGGDAQLMIAAAAPLLPTGKQLSYVYPNGQSSDVVLAHDHIIEAEKVIYRFAPIVQRLSERALTVRIGPGCASACEALVAALRGRATLVGAPTAGLNTVNDVLPLDDQYVLALTIGWMRDRDGQIISGPIPPDVKSKVIN